MSERYVHFSSRPEPPQVPTGKAVHFGSAGGPRAVYAYNVRTGFKPYGADRPYRFIIEPTVPVLHTRTYARADLDRDLTALSQRIDVQKVQRMWQKFKGDFRGNNLPFAMLWYAVTHATDDPDEDSPVSWGSPSTESPRFCRELLISLGHKVIEDDVGIIWSSEPEQALFLTDDSFRVISGGPNVREHLIQLAAAAGPRALAEVQALLESQGTTRLVVLPAEIPGKQTSAWLRSLSQGTSTLVVSVSDGSLRPGMMQRLLGASLPDLGDRLRVLDSSVRPDGLVGAIEDAEAAGAYRAGDALEVYAPEDSLATYQQELSGGSLDFDPTVVSIQASTCPPEDRQSIVDALAAHDRATLQGLLDPHVFSDESGLRAFEAATLSSESLVREFLTDIARTKGEAVQLLVKIIEENSELLEQRGIDIEGARFLGHGNNGGAWRLADGRVLKVTTDDAEAHVASHIRGKRFRHIFTVFDVWAFPGQHNGHHVYGLLQEGGLEKLSPQDKDEFDWMVEVLETVSEDAEQQLLAGDLKPVLTDLMASQRHRPAAAKVLRAVKKFDLPGIMADTKRIGYGADLHSGNIMRRPDGSFVLIDIGTGGSDQDSAKPPFLQGEDVTKDQEDAIFPALHSWGLRPGRKLGAGMNGAAYEDADDPRYVFKVSFSRSEMAAAKALVGKRFRHVGRVFSVQPLTRGFTGLTRDACVIWLERLERLDNRSLAATIAASRIYQSNRRRFPDLDWTDQAAVSEALASTSPDRQTTLRAVEAMNVAQFFDIARDVRAAGQTLGDYHPGNVMRRGGDLVLIDFIGEGDYDGSPVPTRKEEGLPAGVQVLGQALHELTGVQAAPQAGASSHMRGSNSSAWSGGRLVLVDPKNHVPQDDAEDERDRALDQDVRADPDPVDWGFGSHSFSRNR